jgi:signal transduction histidine kinase
MTDESNLASFVGRLLKVAVITLDDAYDVVDADVSACALLDAADVPTLRSVWDELRRRPDFDRAVRETASDASGVASVSMSLGGRTLRLDVRRFAPDRYIVLMRDGRRIDEGDAVGLLASEALANRHVLSGLVHNAKGPLNNFYLRLALLASTLSRETPNEGSASARWKKHVETMQQEAESLLKTVEAIGVLAHPDDSVDAEIDLNATLRDVARLLRHAATIHETAFDVQLPEATLFVHGNARTISLALVALATCLLESSSPNARIALVLSHDDDVARIVLNAAPATLPAALPTIMFNARATDAQFIAQTTARIVIEAHGGSVRIASERSDAWGFALTLPATR